MRRAVATLLLADLRQIVRDPFLLLVVAGPVVLVLVLRSGVPALAGVAPFDLAAHHGLLVGFLLCMLVPQLYGMLLGLLLLDERDAGTLLAIRVTPVALAPFVGYRLAFGVLATGAAVAVGVPATGLVAVGTTGVAVVAVLAAGLAGVPLLAFPAFATNKVEGLALMKAAGLPWLAPVFAWFVEPPWRVAFGVVPSYWPAAALWAAEAGRVPWVELAVGGCYLAGLSWWLGRRLVTRAERSGSR